MGIVSLTRTVDVTGNFVHFASFTLPRGADMLPWVLLFLAIQAVLPRSQSTVFATRVNLFWKLIALAAGCWFIAISTYFLIQARSVVDGVDLAFFVNYARDWVWGYELSGPTRYAYFPGAYVLWAFVLLVYEASDVVVRSTIVAVLLANSILVGCLTRVLTRSTIAAVYAAATYIAIASRYEAFHGTTEPIATIPFLIGVIAWQLANQRRRPYLAAMVVGVGIGVALFCKQQAGLLSLGAIWLLAPESPEQDGVTSSLGSTIRKRTGGLVIATITAAVTFLVAILMLGDGWLPIADGLRTATNYGVAGNWRDNLIWISQIDRSFFVMVVVSTIFLFIPRMPNRRAIGILTVAGFATFIQFRSRGFAHYTLLAVPCFSVVFVSGLCGLWNSNASQSYSSRLKNVALFALILLPAAYVRPDPAVLALLRVWDPISIDENFVAWHEQPRMAESISTLRPLISLGDPIVVVPSRRGVLYREFAAVCPVGYRFSTAVTMNENSMKSIKHVVVVDASLCNEQERQLIGSSDWLTKLDDSETFTRVQADALTIYSRVSNEE